MEHFSNGAILKWSNSQIEHFSKSAIWGRHHQLDDSLVGQLTREESHLTSMINDHHDDDNSRDGDDSGHLMILCSE